ncbi:MAG: glycerol-3-phosphate dehydrogenase [Deltaproteobacteria bacterium]|nr:glycerol-3-phosphate dehydrogenase [Deltaproteobacteria bacterium]
MERRDNTALQDTHFDLLIIGGGITGAGAARDAARRGLSVLVVDQGDVASGTSSRSSKLVHGGLRYLEQGEVALVFEAVAERWVLQTIAPHLVQPMPFLFPIYDDYRMGLFTINIGMWIYDALSLFRSPKIHKKLSQKKVAIVEPGLLSEGLQGAPLYYDCATDDARLTLETILDAECSGAQIRTHTRVTKLLRKDGRVSGAKLEDQLTGEAAEVSASVVINATGPWTDWTRRLSGEEVRPSLRPTKGIHIVVNASRFSVNHAVVCLHPDDGRVLFAVPWGEQTYVGTTDTDFEGDPNEVCADHSDVKYIIEATNTFFPDAGLSLDDVVSTWAGVRPLISEDGAEDESSVSREHEIYLSDDGMITIAGGKLTTYRRMGAEVVRKAVAVLKELELLPDTLRSSDTQKNPLPGAVSWPASGGLDTLVQQVVEIGEGQIDERTAKLLSDTYGTRSLHIAEQVSAAHALGEPLIEGRPEIAGQVEFAVNSELARTVSDVMIRRTQLFYRDADQGLGAVDKVAAQMAGMLNWTPEQTQKNVSEYRAEVERSRCWRTG